MSNARRILKTASKVGMATSVSRVFGYFRDASLAFVLGAGFSMDAFTIAFRLTNLFRRLVAEGATSSALVPVFMEFRTKHSDAELWNFARKLFYTLAVVAGSLAFLQAILANWLVPVFAPGFVSIPEKLELAVLLTRIMSPYLICIAWAAFLMGILNSVGKFTVPALNPVFFNISLIIAAFTVAQWTAEPAVGIAIGVLIGGVLQWLIQIPIAWKQGMRFKPGLAFRNPETMKIGKLLIPATFGIGIVQMNLLIDSIMASLLRQGSVSQIYYADRIMELVLGIFVVSLATVILPDMARFSANKQMEEVKRMIMFSLRATAFVAVPATVGLVALSTPIVHVLFEHGRFTAVDTERTAVALAFYAVGLFTISASRIVISAFHAHQNTKTPVKIAAVAFLLNAILNWILMYPLKQGGIALATSIASAVGFGLLVSRFQMRFGRFEWQPFLNSGVRILIASLIMGASCIAIMYVAHFKTTDPMFWKAMKLFSTIGAGAVVYLASAILLKADEGIVLGQFRKLFQRR